MEHNDNSEPTNCNRAKRKRGWFIGLWVLALLAVAAYGFTASMAAQEPDASVIASSAVSATPTGGASSEPAVSASLSQPQSTPQAIESNPYTGQAAAPLAELNEEYAAYGSFTIAGMQASDYDAAAALEWTDVKISGKPVPVEIDVSALMDYAAIEGYILNLGRYDGVRVSVIGKSERGRNIYMVTVDFPGGTDAQKPLLMLTGGVHAREFAGADYTVKFLNDTLAKAQTDAYTRALLQSVTIVAVPLVNPDGRELIIEGDDPSRKSNANGVDLNRSMPSVNAGHLSLGTKLTEKYSDAPGMDFFAGYCLGSESETRAMIRWMNVYVPQAAAYIDLHQQGGVTFYNKPFVSDASDEACFLFAEEINELLNDGYEPWKERRNYSLDGDGGTMTDYARSLAEGFTYSYRLGRMALLMEGEEVPLVRFGDIDDYMEYYHPLNPDFLCISIEIGRKPSYLGPDEDARERRAREYERYGWEGFLTGTIETLLGKEKVNEIRLGAQG